MFTCASLLRRSKLASSSCRRESGMDSGRGDPGAVPSRLSVETGEKHESLLFWCALSLIRSRTERDRRKESGRFDVLDSLLSGGDYARRTSLLKVSFSGLSRPLPCSLRLTKAFSTWLCPGLHRTFPAAKVHGLDKGQIAVFADESGAAEEDRVGKEMSELFFDHATMQLFYHLRYPHLVVLHSLSHQVKPIWKHTLLRRPLRIRCGSRYVGVDHSSVHRTALD